MKASINEFLKNPIENSDDCSNFYDWFCGEQTLEKRMLSFVPKLKFLVKEGIIDGDKTYVWFKNNCPMSGHTYDDMRISSLNENNDFLGGFCPRTGHYGVEKKCTVWTLDCGLVQYDFDTWADFKREVKKNPSLKAKLQEAFVNKA